MLAITANPREARQRPTCNQAELNMSGTPPFTVRDLGEVAIRCRDLAAMTAFYGDIIGLEVIEGDYRDTIVFLRVGDGFAGHTSVVALFTAEDDDADPEDDLEGGDTSTLHHLALTVKAEDLVPALSWYKAHGIEPWTAEHRWVGWDSVYVKDPEGNTVELVASVRQSSGSGETTAKDT
jgi:catechol-2,3-dioxygenase